METQIHAAGKTGYCRAQNTSRGHLKKGDVFFSVMSRNVPDKLILIESSPGEKEELSFISLTSQMKARPRRAQMGNGDTLVTNVIAKILNASLQTSLHLSICSIEFIPVALDQSNRVTTVQWMMLVLLSSLVPYDEMIISHALLKKDRVILQIKTLNSMLGNNRGIRMYVILLKTTYLNTSHERHHT
ncbi:hypothetical protein TNCV_3678431 [Trichonephila clavipes]|nr:hypothetical protein TNCV_3678431 [Trichonephila clavipes]